MVNVLSRWVHVVWFLSACGGSHGGDAGSDPVDGGDGDGDTICYPLPTDRDGDTINDTHEGAPGADTDGDSTPDFMDADSDGDGVDDLVEAGDANPCTEPYDTDGDHVADFRETDADGNGIGDRDEQDDTDGDGLKDFQDRDDDGDGMFDVNEWGTAGGLPVDSDGDGTPDYHDLDSDNDQVPDKPEGPSDPDEDGRGAYLDDDADGDGIKDTIEAGPQPEAPVDSDDDGQPDFLDVDSDNDGLADHQEDLDADGEVDAGESDPKLADTDGDTYLDIAEWAAGTDPTDPTSTLSADDFYFILPRYEAEKTDDLGFMTDISKADVFFELDATGSMGGTIDILKQCLTETIMPQLTLEIPNIAIGAAYFRDFPVGGFGGCGSLEGCDLPFELLQRITTNSYEVQSVLSSLQASGGGDGPESGFEAIYQAVTGEGIEWDVFTEGRVPKFDALVGYDPLKHGLIGGAGFRQGALPIIVHATDVSAHDAPDYISLGITAAHSMAQATSAAQALGARVIGILTSEWDTLAPTQLRQLAKDTQAMVPPTAWGPGETQCHTGISGAPEPPEAGLCPLMFRQDFGYGASCSAGAAVFVQAVKTLVTFGTIDISAVPVPDVTASPVDTAQFIVGITPIPPPPPGSTIDSDVFREVQPGSPVKFTVHARNTMVDAKREAQLFRVTIRVLGDGVTTLDERDVYVIVPGGGVDP